MVALAALALGAMPTSTGAAGGRIAFVSDRTGNWALWSVDGDGSGLRPLTDARTTLLPPSVEGIRPPRDVPYDRDDAASWSPDGRWIAFSGVRDIGVPVPRRRGAGLFIADAERGGRPRRLTSPVSPAADLDPLWSPDGRFLAFLRFPDAGDLLLSGRVEVWTLDLVSGTQHRLDNGWGPAWSSDGRRVAFVTPDDQGFAEDWVTTAPDGTDRRAILKADLLDGASWSPMERRLAFRDGGSNALLVDEDGRHRQRLKLTDGTSVVTSPVWSPDGRWLAYTATDPDGPTELRVHPAGPGEPRILATFPTGEPFLAPPAWSADGREIAVSEYDAERLVDTRVFGFWRDAVDLLVVPLGGGTPRRLVDEPYVWNLSPAWRPEPSGGRRAAWRHREVRRRAAAHRRAAERRWAAQRRRAAARARRATR